MSNPTTAKPATAVYGSGLTFGANLQSQVPFCSGVGPPVEIKSGTIAQPTIAGASTTIFGLSSYSNLVKSGGPPPWKSNGLTLNGTNYGPSVVFDHSTRALQLGGCGFPTTATNGAALRTIACLFKHSISPYNRNSPTSKNLYPLVHSSGSGGTGLVIAGDNIGSPTVSTDKLRIQYTSGSSVTDPIVPLEVLPNRWYLAAVSIGLIGAVTAAQTQKTFYLYDLTNQILHPGSGIAMVDAANGALATNDLMIGGYGSSLENPFIGEFADVSLHNEAWTPSQFLTYVGDPWSAMRGTYSASGSLAAGAGRMWDATTTSVQVAFPRTTGIGTGGGTGAPTYAAWRAGNPAIAPGATGSVQVASGNINSANGSTVVVSDTGLTAGSNQWYTLVSSDGTQTLNSAPVMTRTMSKSPMVVGIIGDSKEIITSVPETTCAAAMADGRRMVMVDAARPSAGLSTALTPNLQWGIGNVIPAANQAVQVAYKNAASVTGGTFNLIFPFPTPLTASNIPYNATAAQMQAALDAALGSGALSVAISSGTNLTTSNYFTLTGNSGAYQYASWPFPVFDLAGSSLTATATASGQPVAVGVTHSAIYSPGTTANSLYTYAKAEFARVGVQYVILQNAANDTPTSAWQTTLSAMIADLIASGYQVLALYPQSRRTSADLPDATGSLPGNASYDAYMYNFQQYVNAAAAANPGCKVGSDTTYALSCIEMNLATYVDGLHELVGGAWATMVGTLQYRELTNAFDPPAAGSGAPRIGKALIC